jgi:hypothetical protein
MKLYVCWGDWKKPILGHRHPCGDAHQALLDAGYDPEVVKVYGFGPLPMFLQPKRKKVLELTGKTWVPALELDDGSAISDSKKIIEWAGNHPAAQANA